MAADGDVFFDFDNGLHKVGFFLQDILCREPLSPEAERCRQECVRYLQEMSNTLHLIKQNGELSHEDDKLLNLGLSQSSQTLSECDYFGVTDIPRSGSLPNIPSSGVEDANSWGSGKAKKQSDFEPDLNLSDMRELVIYDPIEEEDEDESIEDEEDEDPLNVSNSSRISLKRSRKRDSAVLFDISLGDLEGASDLSGFLTEKHSGKEWWCVLMDQHLCLFPSRDPDELAYDVVIMPCCQISLDDRLMRTPVFRLTQPGMSPWVLVAENNTELKDWIKALTVAASGGKYSVTQESSEDDWRSGGGGRSMQIISEEEAAEELLEDHLTHLYTISGSSSEFEMPKASLCAPIEEQEEEEEKDEIKHQEVVEENKSEIEEIFEVNIVENAQEPSPPLSSPESDEIFGEDLYEAIENDNEDDGFATDEFESGSSDNENAPSSPKGSPRMQRKIKKKSQLLKWLKKKTKAKDRLFASPQDGVALAGYVHRIENNSSSKRWCVIREGNLYCYKNIKDEDTELTLELDGTEIRAKEEDKNKFIIRVMKNNERLIALAAKNTKDMEKWKTALKIESGFIKLATPGDTSSGIYDDDEGDYVTPLSPSGRQRVTNGHAKTVTLSTENTITNQNGNDDIEDGVYIDVVSPEKEIEGLQQYDNQESLGPLPSIPKDSRSPDPESLGPLLPLPDDAKPPELPPPRRSPIPLVEVKDRESKSEDSEEFEEIYEEMPHVSPNADKLTQWAVDRTTGVEDTEEQPKGPAAVGIEDGSIGDDAMTASSFKDKNTKPHLARLNAKDGAWCAEENDKTQYMEIDLGAATKVCGVATQGRPSFDDDGGWFVKSYTLSYSKNKESWTIYKEFGIAKVLQGNCDPDCVVANMFKMAVNARYIRFKPQTWHNHIAMRVEVYEGEAGSKLTAGIHKLAGSITKAGTNMLHEMKPSSPEPKEKDVQINPPSPSKVLTFDEKKSAFQKPPFIRKVSFDDKVQVINEHLPPSLKPEACLENGNGDSNGDGKPEKSEEPQNLDKKDQNKTVTNGESPNPLKTPSEKEVRSLPSRTLKQSWIKEKSNTNEKRRIYCDVIGKAIIEQDKEREMLRKKEEEFLEIAKELKEEGSVSVREKRPSLVALNRITFENRDLGKGRDNPRYITKSQALFKEKNEIIARMELQKRRVGVAKDRKIFFTLSSTSNTAKADAETEFHDSQLQLAKAKRRIAEIDNELKNIKLLDLKHEGILSPLHPHPSKQVVRKNSREVKIPADEEGTPLKADSKDFNPEGPPPQKGSVLSHIKAFEQMKGKK